MKKKWVRVDFLTRPGEKLRNRGHHFAAGGNRPVEAPPGSGPRVQCLTDPSSPVGKQGAELTFYPIKAEEQGSETTFSSGKSIGVRFTSSQNGEASIA